MPNFLVAYRGGFGRAPLRVIAIEGPYASWYEVIDKHPGCDYMSINAIDELDAYIKIKKMYDKERI